MNSLRRSITHGQSYWMDDLTRGMMTGGEIPGTPAGVPAIEQMLYEGININVTLLFAIEDYEAVAHAYIAAGFAGRSLRNGRVGKAESLAAEDVSTTDCVGQVAASMEPPPITAKV